MLQKLVGAAVGTCLLARAERLGGEVVAASVETPLDQILVE